MEVVHGSVHRSVCRCLGNGKRLASLSRANDSHLDASDDESDRIADGLRLAARVHPAPAGRALHRVDEQEVPAISVGVGRRRSRSRGRLVLLNSVLHQLLRYHDTHFGHLLRHCSRRHRYSAHSRLSRRCATHLGLWLHLCHCGHFLLARLCFWTGCRWQYGLCCRIYRIKHR